METIEFDAAREAAKKAFCEAMYTGATTVVIGGEERAWTWVLDQLRYCCDDMPEHVCDLLDCDVYATAVKSWWCGMDFKAYFLPKMLDDPSLSPEQRAGLEWELDFLYRVTGWDRPTAGNN